MSLESFLLTIRNKTHTHTHMQGNHVRSLSCRYKLFLWENSDFTIATRLVINFNICLIHSKYIKLGEYVVVDRRGKVNEIIILRMCKRLYVYVCVRWESEVLKSITWWYTHIQLLVQRRDLDFDFPKLKEPSYLDLFDKSQSTYYVYINNVSILSVYE